jgi:hypothetical protein
VRIADFTIELLLGHEGCHRVDDDHIDGVGLNQHLANLQGFFSIAGLADKEHFQVYAELLAPAGVKSMLGID